MIDNSFNKKSFFRSKGIYILAALCILAAGAGVWGAMRVAKYRLLRAAGNADAGEQPREECPRRQNDCACADDKRK